MAAEGVVSAGDLAAAEKEPLALPDKCRLAAFAGLEKAPKRDASALFHAWIKPLGSAALERFAEDTLARLSSDQPAFVFDVLCWIPLAPNVSDALVLKVLAFFFVSAFFTSEADSISLKKVLPSLGKLPLCPTMDAAGRSQCRQRLATMLAALVRRPSAQRVLAQPGLRGHAHD